MDFYTFKNYNYYYLPPILLLLLICDFPNKTDCLEDEESVVLVAGDMPHPDSRDKLLSELTTLC